VVFRADMGNVTELGEGIVLGRRIAILRVGNDSLGVECPAFTTKSRSRDCTLRQLILLK
jgi:hypothetical protein